MSLEANVSLSFLFAYASLGFLNAFLSIIEMLHNML